MQLQKQARRAARQEDETIRFHKVKVDKFNPVVPKGIEMTFASYIPKGEVVLVTSQRRMA